MPGRFGCGPGAVRFISGTYRQHVELAMAHGINVFIVDWYWYENAPCFERQLNEGLIPALNQGLECALGYSLPFTLDHSLCP